MSAPEPEPVRQPTLLTSPMNSDDDGMSEDQRRKANLGKKMAQRGTPQAKGPSRPPTPVNVPAEAPSPKVKRTTSKRPPPALSAPDAKSPTTKAAAPQKAPAEPKPVPEAKASTPRKGQESPEAKASHPMATRKTASGVGSLRSGGGSGQTATCVASGNPPKT
jgi:hypothetical protein